MRSALPSLPHEVRGGAHRPVDRRHSARQLLFEALAGRQEPNGEGLEALSSAAEWPLPRDVRAVAALPIRRRPSLHGFNVLLRTGPEGPRLFLPDHSSLSRAAASKAFHGATAVIGPLLPIEKAGLSMHCAERLLMAMPMPMHTANGPRQVVLAEEHLPTLVMLHNYELAGVLAAKLLRPLADVTPGRRDRLERTLLAWLKWGAAPEAARALHVHPQTVRYRMRQIEPLLGTALRDPDTRFALELALRSRLMPQAGTDTAQRQEQPLRQSDPRGLSSHMLEARRNGL